MNDVRMRANLDGSTDVWIVLRSPAGAVRSRVLRKGPGEHVTVRELVALLRDAGGEKLADNMAKRGLSQESEK